MHLKLLLILWLFQPLATGYIQEPKDSFILFGQYLDSKAHHVVKSVVTKAKKPVAKKRRIVRVITQHKIPTPTRTVTTRNTSVAAARQYARARLGEVQFSCLDKLWYKESHWNPFDLNRRSGAYGIPQAVPGSKMRSAGSDWRTNPMTQVRWGLGYIRARYGTACNAWHHSQKYNWY